MLENIRIVLVGSKTPGNIGASARAMKNMGITDLYLVSPRNYPDPSAVWRASHATDVLEQATICDSLEEALATCNLVIGTSARERYLASSIIDAKQAATKVYQQPDNSKIAIVFGREDKGLTNAELQQCHFHLYIPTSEYNSLNLAAAVQVVCYEIYQSYLDHTNTFVRTNTRELASQEQIQMLLQHLEKTLIDLKFYKLKQANELMSRLQRLIMRSQLDNTETNILRGILASVDKVMDRKR